jgi:hypothetical protein
LQNLSNHEDKSPSITTYKGFEPAQKDKSGQLGPIIAAQKWAVFWQQPNAAKTMCYQLLPRAEVGCVLAATDVGCVLAATECGQSNVLSVIAKAMCYQLLPQQRMHCRRGVAELGQNDVLLLYTLVKG